jgi:hypothetical protein
MAVMTQSASGESESLNAEMIHCLLGMIRSRARIAAPMSQLKTMRIRRTMCAIGRAGDDVAGVDMRKYLSISIINK